MAKDFLDEIIDARSAVNPAFPRLVQAAEDRRLLLRSLAAARKHAGRSQTDIAAAMGSSQAQVARLEAAECDVRVSTLEKFAAALGMRIEWRLIDADS